LHIGNAQFKLKAGAKSEASDLEKIDPVNNAGKKKKKKKIEETNMNAIKHQPNLSELKKKNLISFFLSPLKF